MNEDLEGIRFQKPQPTLKGSHYTFGSALGQAQRFVV